MCQTHSDACHMESLNNVQTEFLFPPNSCGEALAPPTSPAPTSVATFGDGASKIKWGLNEVMRVGL